MLISRLDLMFSLVSLFLQRCPLTFPDLWSIHTVDFNPIENLDWTSVRDPWVEIKKPCLGMVWKMVCLNCLCTFMIEKTTSGVVALSGQEWYAIHLALRLSGKISQITIWIWYTCHMFAMYHNKDKSTKYRLKLWITFISMPRESLKIRIRTYSK